MESFFFWGTAIEKQFWYRYAEIICILLYGLLLRRTNGFDCLDFMQINTKFWLLIRILRMNSYSVLCSRISGPISNEDNLFIIYSCYRIKKLGGLPTRF